MKILFIIPGDINLPTGGYRYDKQIIEAWKNSGFDVTLISIIGSYPFPSDEDQKLALEEISNFPKADIAVVDGLLGGTSPKFMEAVSQKMPTVALIHHPLCLENGLDKQTAQKLKALEHQGLEFTSSLITTSPTTSKTVSGLFGYAINKIHTVLPGVERGNISTGSQTECINLLCVGSIIERKGHKVLLQALSELKALNWKLDCIGSTNFDPKLYDKLKNIIAEEGLSKKVIFHGAVDEAVIQKAYESADVFVLPSLFEGYGMAYAEAIVRGIPVIGTTAGAIPETVPDACGILVEPENVKELAQALEQLITNTKLREQYKKKTLKAEPSFPTWESSANQFIEILKDIS